MKSFGVAVLFGIAAILAGCADSVSKPVPVVALAPEQKSELKIADVMAEAAPGVDISRYDLDRIAGKLKGELQLRAAEMMAGENEPAPSTMKVVFTEYDAGNAFARAMLAGLGQIEIEADVFLIDAAGKTVAQYEVSKNFAFGGIYGASTSIEDVEVGFVKSVVEIVSEKQT
ncbi:DUF4410 domain-containing protein [Parvibaculum sp.]|jgi:hypothetical protein|uniref:DUF4410 domain-containing protein n=1 Tax=Parvibaculum sp. TaxID=2024848 RepID=UPI000C5655C4|nr:DUF4410 domain-containing protein [Parvibaculum sp.]HAC58743.1 hypothetical protein [Rhodobiaceae bacterium]MAU60016.1 hypothetical protein [Parvibaculum sp.]MBO6668957.1 DUF4410 domain-containing protein [Parvibaculum sp.]MBO6693483.1 DUF4410 domain-containing protein [Parvibaculum sp.]MBO6715493.1 DUF4410 domain-containing protein [Parvibaculum sp.]|tara:strand:+ start:144 stop:659 length:516 start_codon:yes stop_codon:yes gene_type:complete